MLPSNLSERVVRTVRNSAQRNPAPPGEFVQSGSTRTEHPKSELRTPSGSCRCHWGWKNQCSNTARRDCVKPPSPPHVRPAIEGHEDGLTTPSGATTTPTLRTARAKERLAPVRPAKRPTRLCAGRSQPGGISHGNSRASRSLEAIGALHAAGKKREERAEGCN